MVTISVCFIFVDWKSFCTQIRNILPFLLLICPYAIGLFAIYRRSVTGIRIVCLTNFSKKNFNIHADDICSLPV